MFFFQLFDLLLETCDQFIILIVIILLNFNFQLTLFFTSIFRLVTFLDFVFKVLNLSLEFIFVLIMFLSWFLKYINLSLKLFCLLLPLKISYVRLQHLNFLHLILYQLILLIDSLLNIGHCFFLSFIFHLNHVQF